MKYLLFFALALLGVSLTAQNSTSVSASKSSNTSVSESSTDDSYSFSIKVDRNQADILLAAYMKVAEITSVSKIVGTSSYTTDEGAVMDIDTKKRTLRISSDDDRPDSISDARGLADQVREELGLAPAPAPPKW